MDNIETLEIERECERLVTRYCHHCDHGEAARVADLFTEDGIWESPEAKLVGRDQIREGFQRRQDMKERMSRHVCNNLLVDVVNENEAEGTVYLTLYRHDGEAGRPFAPLDGPVMVGEYRDHFLKTDEGWRISRRTVVVSFLNVGKET
jgi:ketosteroid isomerase-like protein